MELTFADVLEIYNGRNQRHVENPAGKYPIYGSGGVMGFADDFICPENTVVIGRKGNINKPIFVTKPFWNVDTAFGLVAKPDILLPKYLYYFCEWFDFEKLNTTVTIPSLTKANLLQIHIHLPSMEDQRKIMQKLEAVESLISHRQDEIHALDQLIKARFVELFGHSAKRRRLEDYTELITKGASPKWQGVDYTDEGTLFVTSENVREGYVDLSKRKYLPDTINEIQPRSVLHRNDVLINIVGASIGRAAIFNSNELANINQAVALVRLREKAINLQFLITFLNSQEAQRLYGLMKKGGARDNLSLKNISDLMIPIASIPEQERFASFVSQVDKSKLSLS